MSDTASYLPPVDFDALEADLVQRCPYCRTKLLPIIETQLGLVWACPNKNLHGYTRVFWGDEHGEEGLRNVRWIIDALTEKAS